MPAKEILNLPNSEEIRAAAKKLFGEDRSGVKRFERSGVRYVEMPGELILVEQNPRKDSHWAKLAREGHKLAWLMKDGDYLARVIDDQVEMLQPK